MGYLENIESSKEMWNELFRNSISILDEAHTYELGTTKRNALVEKSCNILHTRMHLEKEYATECSLKVYEVLKQIKTIEISDIEYTSTCWIIQIKHPRYTMLFLPYEQRIFEVMTAIAYIKNKKGHTKKIRLLDDISYELI